MRITMLSGTAITKSFLVLILSVSLAGCSTSWAGLGWNSSPTMPKLAGLNPIPPNLPDPPPSLIGCFRTKLPSKKAEVNAPAPSADQMAMLTKQAADQRQVCGRKLLAWYHKVQVDNGVKPAKPAPATSSSSFIPAGL